jgi:hypothetical protein
MLIVASWSEQFRADIGLKGFSQVWGGPPAWYIWLADAPGVYHLELVETEEEKLNGKNLCKGVLAVKCYPYPDDACFQSFSFFEQALINSHFFDKTHTPVFEHREKIPSDFFTIAMLEIVMDDKAYMASFCVETLDVLRNRYDSKTDQMLSIMDLDRQFAAGEIDRDILGLKIAYPLFDCLICLHSNASKQAPFQVQCSKTPGFEFVIEQSEVNARPDKDINGYRMTVLYTAVDRHEQNNTDPALIDPRANEETSFYERVFPCGHFHDDDADEILPVSINKKWWSLAYRQYASELASSCGCHG